MTLKPAILLLVAIDEYQNIPRLEGCLHDAEQVEAFFKVKYPHLEWTVVKLLNQEASKAKIKDHLKKLVDPAVHSDIPIIFYFAGHGSRIKVQSPGSAVKDIEIVCPVDYDPTEPLKTGILDFKVNLFLTSFFGKQRNVTLIMDCCHSGGVDRDAGTHLRPRYVRRRDDTVYPITDFPFHSFKPSDSSFHVLLAACREDELAFEDGKNGGCFTTQLINYLNKSPGKLTYGHLQTVFESWQIRKDFPRDQHPVCRWANKGRNRFLFQVEEADIGTYRLEKTEDSIKIHDAGVVHGLPPLTVACIVVGDDKVLLAAAKVHETSSIIPIDKELLDKVLPRDDELQQLRPHVVFIPTLDPLRAVGPLSNDFDVSKLQVAILDPIVKNGLLKPTPGRKLTTANEVLFALASFLYHLARQQPTDLQHPLTVSIQSQQLVENAYNTVCVRGEGCSIEIANESGDDLYIYLLLFNAETFEIKAIQEQVRVFSIQSRISAGQSNQCSIFIPQADLENFRDGYIKVFASTEPLDLSRIQTNPLQGGGTVAFLEHEGEERVGRENKIWQPWSARIYPVRLSVPNDGPPIVDFQGNVTISDEDWRFGLPFNTVVRKRKQEDREDSPDADMSDRPARRPRK